MKDRTRLLARLEWGLALAASAFSLILHWRWKSHAAALWRDEVDTAQFATMPGLKEIWTSLAYDNFPPLVLVPMRLWAAVGGATDAGWRWFGLLMGLAVLATLWIIGRRFPTRIPLLALVFVGLSPLAVRTIDSIRPNGLGILLACATFGCFWRAATAPGRRSALWAAGAAILSVQCLYTNAAFVLASACAAVVLALRHRNRKTTLLILAAGAAAAVSLLIHVAHLKTGRDWGIVVLPVPPTPTTEQLDVSLAALFESGPLAAIAMILAVPIIFGRLVLEHSSESKNKSRSGTESRESRAQRRLATDPAWFAGIALLVGSVAYFALLSASHLPTRPWYYVILIAFVALAVDSTVAISEPIRWSRLGLAAVAGLFVVVPAWKGTSLRQTNVDLLAQKVQTTASKEDFILVNPWYFGTTWQRYYHGETPWETIPPLPDHRIHRYDWIKELMVRTNQSDVMQPVLERIRTTLQSGHRVWLVGGFQPMAPGKLGGILPPAPQSEARWSAEAYQTSWAFQASTLLETHATKAAQVTVESSIPVNPYENANLVVIEGWRAPFR